jgi:hypothetical protein
MEALERPRRQPRKGPPAMTDISEADRLALLAKCRKLMEDWSAFATASECRCAD